MAHKMKNKQLMRKGEQHNGRASAPKEDVGYKHNRGLKFCAWKKIFNSKHF